VSGHVTATVAAGAARRVPWAPFDAQAVRELYDDYAAFLDAADYAAWLDLFDESASYTVTARENAERGLPLATIRCDSRGMLADRIDALVTTQFFARRITRHVITAIRPVGVAGDRLHTSANFVLVETIEGGSTHIQSAGTYDDVVVSVGGELRFIGKRAIYDAALVSTSLIVPL
jgi:3-phenylpropionate/cinnamic acid dioxygenase small subunit